MYQSAAETAFQSLQQPLSFAEETDLRFHRLLGERWDRLPAKVQARFAKRLKSGRSLSYKGVVQLCRRSRAGWLLAQACRLIGAPLPLRCDSGTAAVVTVTEDHASGGQVWTRLYAHRRGFPQVIHSAKRFAGPTGLEEYLGGGFGIALRVVAQDSGLGFVSDHYFFLLGPWRLCLPRFLSPGVLEIGHCDLGAGAFTYSLTLRHRLFGELLHQVVHFFDETVISLEEPTHE